MAINFPSSPSVNDSYTASGKTWVWNGEYWKLYGTQVQGINLEISDTPPSPASTGDMWFESDTGSTFTYYDGAWVELGNTATVTAFLTDADGDTVVHVEDSSDDDTIRFDTAGVERMTIGASGDIVISNDLTVDTNTLHVDSTTNRVGIGTTSPTNTLHVDSGSTAQFAAPQIYVAPSGHASSDRAAIQLDDIQLLTDIAGNGNEDFSIYSNGAAAHRLSIDSSGNVGIATTTPNFPLHVNGKAVVGGGDNQTPDALGNGHLMIDGNGYTGFASLDGTAMWVGHNSSSRDLYLATNETARVTVTGGGLVGIGTSTPPAQLTVQAASTGLDDGTVEIHSWLGDPASPTEAEDWPTPLLALRGYDNYNRQSMLSFGYPQDAIYQTGNGVWNFRLETTGGGATASSASTHLELYGPGTFKVGALSKLSGSFQIPHPLPEKADTHDLVHSFIEGPQADLIYRGRATLVDGQATINIDESAGMTEGTFVALCRDIQCLTSNESGWTAVRGSVTGNTLTIEAQDPACTDTISWMVVGERQDQHMIDTNWTDETGKVIVEPLTTRPTEEELAASIARMEAARAAKEQAAEEIV